MNNNFTLSLHWEPTACVVSCECDDGHCLTAAVKRACGGRDWEDGTSLTPEGFFFFFFFPSGFYVFFIFILTGQLEGDRKWGEGEGMTCSRMTGGIKPRPALPMLRILLNFSGLRVLNGD